MDHVDSGISLLSIWFVTAAVLVVLGIGLLVLTKERREKFRRHAVAGHLSTMFRTLLTLLVVGIAVPVFLVLLYLQNGNGRSTTDAYASALDSSKPTVTEQEHLHGEVPTGTPDPELKLLCDESPASADLPAWVCQPQTRDGRRTLVVVVGEQFVTTEEAEQNALEQAEQRLQADFERSHPTDVTWTIPLDLIQTPALLRNRFLRHIKRISGSTTFHVQQMFLQLELSPESRKLIYPVWRDRIVGHRLWILGRVLLLLTGILATATLYFRLDARTDGQFRLRLKLAAIVVIVAFGILIETTAPSVERFVVG